MKIKIAALLLLITCSACREDKKASDAGVTTGRIPIELLKPVDRSVSDLKLGETGYISDYPVFICADGTVLVDGAGVLSREKNNYRKLTVTLHEDGLHIDIRPMGSDLKTHDCGTSSTRYITASKVTHALSSAEQPR